MVVWWFAEGLRNMDAEVEKLLPVPHPDTKLSDYELAELILAAKAQPGLREFSAFRVGGSNETWPKRKEFPFFIFRTALRFSALFTVIQTRGEKTKWELVPYEMRSAK